MSSSASTLSTVTSLTSATTGIANSTLSQTSLPSTKELVLSPFRLIARTDRLIFRTIPTFVLRTARLDTLAANIANTLGFRGAAGGGGGELLADVGQAAGQQAVAEVEARTWTTFFNEALQSGTFKSYWGMLHYLASRWAVTCFVLALILNRVGVYSASRQRISLTWNKRLALRVIPILLLFTQIRHLLQAIRCQTSPDFAIYRHGDYNKYSLLDWSTEGGPLHSLTSTMLYWSTDEAACAAVEIGRPAPDVKAPHGSFSLLWPTFLRLSLSHLVESVSCSLQQVPMMTEVGMSVFEHSLAFAEAETMITHTLGLGLFSNPKPSSSAANITDPAEPSPSIPASGTLLALTDAIQGITGPHLLDRINVPVEVLLVALISCCNSFTSNIISVLGKQKQLRLVNTAIWGICFMTAFVWGFFTTSSLVRVDGESQRPVSGLLHFPTVVIVGFLPHLTIILGVVVCGLIYLLALTLTAVSLGTNPHIPQPSSLSERLSIAHDNLQAAVQIRGLSIRWYEDFYTALLRMGFAALTAASEAVFLNEGRSVEMRRFTWLEEERLDEFEQSGLASKTSDVSHFQIVEEYGIPVGGRGLPPEIGSWQSGFGKERRVDQSKNGHLQNKDSYVYPNPRTDGVGALQRTTRFYLLFIFLRGIMLTISGWVAFGIGASLDGLGLTYRPNWLKNLIGLSVNRIADERGKLRTPGDGTPLDFWFLTDDGKLESPKTDDMDIEAEMRKRVMMDTAENVDEALDEKMYDWWKLGGWFGTRDESGDYQPSSTANPDADQDDATSVVSTATGTSLPGQESDGGWESESDGQRTPTRKEPNPSWSFASVRRRESEDETSLLDMSTLARLLNPPDGKSREEARMLSSHLASAAHDGKIMTRSRYRQQHESERSRVLLAGRAPLSVLPGASTSSAPTPSARPLSRDEEAEVLEKLILERRKWRSQPRSAYRANDDTNSEEQMGAPCVVCQTAPRSIIAWPCRCLCVCEDCRVSLAMNNFGNCVTCRRTVGGFVRLYVP